VRAAHAWALSIAALTACRRALAVRLVAARRARVCAAPRARSRAVGVFAPLGRGLSRPSLPARLRSPVRRSLRARQPAPASGPWPPPARSGPLSPAARSAAWAAGPGLPAGPAKGLKPISFFGIFRISVGPNLPRPNTVPKASPREQ